MIRLSLYEIDRELEELEDAIIEAGGEITPEIEERYDDLLEMRPDKIEGYIRVIRKLEATSKGIADERKRLQDAEKAAQNAAKRLKDRLAYQMDRRGETEHVTTIGKIKLQSASVRPVILSVDLDDLPEHLRRVKVDAVLKAIGDLLKKDDPEAAKYASFGEASKFVRIY